MPDPVDSNTVNLQFVRSFLPMMGFIENVSEIQNDYVLPILDSAEYAHVVVRNGAAHVGVNSPPSPMTKLHATISLAAHPDVFARRLQRSIEEVLDDARRKGEGGAEAGAG